MAEIGERLPRTIILIGCRGAGKTAVARYVADRLGWNAVDADDAIEQRTGLSIRAIFAEKGEEEFRRIESELLPELLANDRQVLATGGGVILDPINRRRLRDAGWVVWLTADVEMLDQRLRCDPTSSDRRPPLTANEGRDEIRDILRRREPLYRECAHLVIDTSRLTIAQVAERILSEYARQERCFEPSGR